MASLKKFEMRLLRPRLGVGTKTLIALSIVFWVPVSVLAVIMFYLFQGLLYDEGLNSIKVNLKGAREVCEGQINLVKGVTAQFTARQEVKVAILKKDAAKLQTLLLEFGKNNPYIDILTVVDSHQRVISRKTDRRGDILSISGLLSTALFNGKQTSSTELVSRDFLKNEDEDLVKRVKDLGLVQFVVSPVKYRDRTIGALVAGSLLTGDPWLGNAVYRRFGVEMALFAGQTPQTFLLHSTASLPRSTWAIGQSMPEKLREEIAFGRPYYGTLTIGGTEHLVAYEPLMDSRNSIIGAIGVSMPAKKIQTIVLYNIGKGIFVVALVGLVISIIITTFVKADITRPLETLARAMEAFGRGERNVSVDIKTGDQFETLGEGFNRMAEGIKKKEERLKKHNEIAKLLMSTLDLKELMEKMLNIAVNVTESHMGIVYLCEENNTRLVPRVMYGTKAEIKPLKMGEGYPGRAAKENKKFIISLPQRTMDEVLELGFIATPPGEVAYIPLSYRDRVLGVLVLGSINEYTEDEVNLFDYLANQISIALDNAIMHQRIQELSITDALTGLYNRRYLNSRLEEEWARAVRHGKPLSILLFDVDNFKSINDTYGHDKGDEVLKGVASVLKENVRKEDLASRYGGEEFVVVLVDIDMEDARKFGERIRELVKARVYDWMDRNVTISVGVATYPRAKAKNYEELIQFADQAMYRAKVSGKDRVIVYEEGKE